MRRRRLKLISDKTKCMFVPTNSSLHGIVTLIAVMLGNIPVQLSNSVRNLGFVSVNQLNLDEQNNYVMREVIVSLINISRNAKFIYIYYLFIYATLCIMAN